MYLTAPVGLDRQWQNPLLRSILVFAGANTWTREGSVFFKVGSAALNENEVKALNLSSDQLAQSRFEVGNGFLTAYEVANMDLRNTKIVNLTACDTGVGEITAEGVAGLRQAFLLAGARSVTISMWSVPAAETVRQMTDFYEIWLDGAIDKTNQTKSRYQSFRSAQLNALQHARDEYGSGHPYFWAGLVYAGDPGDLANSSLPPGQLQPH